MSFSAHIQKRINDARRVYDAKPLVPVYGHEDQKKYTLKSRRAIGQHRRRTRERMIQQNIRQRVMRRKPFRIGEATILLGPQVQRRIDALVRDFMEITDRWLREGFGQITPAMWKEGVRTETHYILPTRDLAFLLYRRAVLENNPKIHIRIELRREDAALFAQGMYLFDDDTITLFLPEYFLVVAPQAHRIHPTNGSELRDTLNHEWLHRIQNRLRDRATFGSGKLSPYSSAVAYTMTRDEREGAPLAKSLTRKNVTQRMWYYGRPEEIASWATGYAKRLHTVWSLQDPRARAELLSNLKWELAHYIRDLRTRSSPKAANIFLRHFMATMQSYGYSSATITGFLSSVKLTSLPLLRDIEESHTPPHSWYDEKRPVLVLDVLPTYSRENLFATKEDFLHFLYQHGLGRYAEYLQDFSLGYKRYTFVFPHRKLEHLRYFANALGSALYDTFPDVKRQIDNHGLQSLYLIKPRLYNPRNLTDPLEKSDLYSIRVGELGLRRQERERFLGNIHKGDMRIEKNARGRGLLT